MSDIVCVTNRKLCPGDFPERIGRLAACRPAAVLLREKDLPEGEYETLARQVMQICSAQDVPCILHTYADAAKRLGAPAVHLPLSEFAVLNGKYTGQSVPAIGVSVHSAEEAALAERLGASYLIVGHIFHTDCKEGLPGRGLPFLREVCGSVRLPVLAIGGIRAENAPDVRAAGAAGICVMSGAMQCEEERAFLESLENAGEP